MPSDPSSAIIAGIDEAGRGALAGPVVAGACIIDIPLFRRKRQRICWSPFRQRRSEDCLVADSKQLSPEQRETAYAWIISHCPWGVGIVPHAVIEAEGILAATEQAMHRALAALRRMREPTFLIVDGRDRFWFDLPHASVVRGDESEPAIAAASIIAKVTRDRLMRRSGDVFPGFGFETHKGYGAPEHIAAIRTRGASPIHRNSFLQNIIHASEERGTTARGRSREREASAIARG